MRLPLHSPALERALWDGSLPRAEVPSLAGAAGASVPLRALAVTAEGEVELAVGPVPGRPSDGKVWFEAIRAISLTATATPCIAAVLAVLGLGLPVSWPVVALALLGALLMQVSVNLENDVEDYRRLIDLPGTLGGSGVLHKGWLSARGVERVARLSLLAGVALGIPTVMRAPGPMAVVAILALVGTAGYSGRPFGFKYKALGDLAVILLCGPVLTLGMGIAATGTLVEALVPLGMAFGLLAVGILHANNLQDIGLDGSRGARTVASLLGEGSSKAYLVLLYAAGIAGWVATALWLSLPVLAAIIPVVALIPTGKLLSKVLRAPTMQAPELALVRIEAAQLHLAWGVLFIVALGAALALR